MSKSLLSEYGPERSSGSRARNGGQMPVKPLAYSPPQGPKGIDHNSVGLGGRIQRQGYSTDGSIQHPQGEERVSIGATNHGCCGSQGKH